MVFYYQDFVKEILYENNLYVLIHFENNNEELYRFIYKINNLPKYIKINDKEKIYLLEKNNSFYKSLKSLPILSKF